MKSTPKALKEGYLKRDHHRIYYGAYGNPKAKKVWMFCHGGPGYHTNPSSNLKNFDLQKEQVILFDQRGAGKSLPHGDLKKNTTFDLVGDMKALMELLKVKKVNLMGGSWGSTLALIFAIQNPDLVESLVLRGIFLGRKKDVVDLYEPQENWSWDQTEKWNMTLKVLKSKYKLKHVFDGLKILRKKDKNSLDFAKHWAAYEDLICSKGFRLLDFDEEYLKMAMAISLIEIHYFVNNCFIPENYILNNLSKIKNLPTFIVHGGEDMVCPKEQALLLCAGLNSCELYIDPKGGHSSTEEMNKVMKSMVSKSRKLK